MSDAYIALGANLGDRQANLRAALHALAGKTRLVAVSALYETDAMTPDGSAQPQYLNAACHIETGLDPHALLHLLQAIERDLGRPEDHERWAPRPIDLDILLYDDLVLDSPELVLPHPRMAERAFVLVPLRDVAAVVVHPVLCRTIAELSAEKGAVGVQQVAGVGWER